MDYAQSKRKKLYICAIRRFLEAYDQIKRAALMMKLKLMGCGAAMIVAIACMYSCTQMALENYIYSIDWMLY